MRKLKFEIKCTASEMIDLLTELEDKKHLRKIEKQLIKQWNDSSKQK
jgi:hypothetical protein